MKSLLAVAAVVALSASAFGQCAVVGGGYNSAGFASGGYGSGYGINSFGSGACGVANQSFRSTAIYHQSQFDPRLSAGVDYRHLQHQRQIDRELALRDLRRQQALREQQLYNQQYYGRQQSGFGGGFARQSQGFGGGNGGGGNFANFANALFDPQTLGAAGGAIAGTAIAGPGAGLAGAGIGAAVGSIIGSGFKNNQNNGNQNFRR